MAPTVANTLVGKIGNVYVAPFGTAAPFTVPPNSSVDAGALTLPAPWTAGNLGYIHEDDTPTFSWDISSTQLTAWQLNGSLLRNLQTGKARSVKFTCREFNKNVWNQVEPGTTYTAGANGTTTLTIPDSSANPNKAGLVEIQDLDFGIKLYIYVPSVNVSEIGDMKPGNADTMNTQLTWMFMSNGAGLPLYYIATNHPGMQ